MTKQLLKKAAATATAFAILSPLAVMAQGVNNTNDSTLGSTFGLGTGTDVRGAIVNIIALLLGFLGLVAVLIVLYGGFQWMTAAGNEDKISSARATLTAGLIGLIIILAAYAITQFVIGTIVNEVTN